MKKLLLFLLLTITINSFGQLAKERLPKPGSISGKVIDALSKQPLEYATIVIKNTETQKISGGITDAKGLFNVKTPVGNYEISIEFISVFYIIV